MNQFKTYFMLLCLIIVCGLAMGCGSNLNTKNANENKVDFKLSGISDYKVVTNENAALQNSITKAPLDELEEMAVTLQSRSSKKAFLEDLPAISYLELKDAGYLEDFHVYYCRFSEGNKKLYVFVYADPGSDNRLVIIETSRKNRSLLFQDFDSVVVPNLSLHPHGMQIHTMSQWKSRLQ